MPLQIGGIDLYLSRVFLDPGKRETMRLLSSPEYLHGAVERSFFGGRQRRLWRVDVLHGNTCLMVLSPDEPDFTQMIAQYGVAGQTPPWESRLYKPFLERLKEGQLWQFRLKANPVRSVKEAEGRGKVMAHVTPEQQKEWLQKRSESCGFALTPDSFEVVHTQWQRFQKSHGHQVTLRTATFEGWLTIRNAVKLQRALMEGIGRAKAYGCGLLTLARGQNHG